MIPVKAGGRWLVIAYLGYWCEQSALLAEEHVSEARMRRDITILASDEFEGRGVATQGINRAADYIARAFREAGLKPGAADGSYFQPFTIKGATQAGPSRMRLTGPQGQDIVLQQGAHFQPLGMSAAGQGAGPLVFAGYGITAAKNPTYDDYKDLDVHGKIVVVLRDTPRVDNKDAAFGGARRRELASFTRKMQNAASHGAAAIIFVSDRDVARDDDDLLDFNYLASGDGPVDSEGQPIHLPAFHLRRSVLDGLLRESIGRSLSDVEADIDRTLKPQSVDLAGWRGDVDVKVKREGLKVKNVVGVLDGQGPLAKETLIVGAHYDHLGYGGPGSLMASSKKPAIHHGADDNGSGTTALLELARRFAQRPDRQGRRLVFIAFSGEESGLLGSRYYCKEPLFPLTDTVAMVNLDMVGRLRAKQDVRGGWSKILTLLAPERGLSMLTLAPLRAPTSKVLFETKDQLLVYGTGSAASFEALIDRLNARHNFGLTKFRSGMGTHGSSSDHESFYLKQIPVFFFFTGDHADYHRPSDTSDRINVTGMRRVVDFVEELLLELTRTPQRPVFVKVVEPSTARAVGKLSIPRLGIRPDYGYEGEGVMLSGVTDGGPAAKVGLKEGDCIVGVGGKPVPNLPGYMAVLANHKAGQPVQLEIKRDGKMMQVQVVPE